MIEPRPTTVLLDVGFTLTFPDHQVIARHAAASGLAVDAAVLARTEDVLRREIVLYPWASTPSQVATRPRSAGADFFRRMLDLAGVPGSAESLDAAATFIWDRHLEKNVWCRVGVGVERALARLREAGVRLAVVSNSEGTVEAMLNEVGLAGYFHTILDSWVVGVAKPDPGIFHLALKRLGAQASEAVMLGDVPKFDIDGARAAGVRAVLVDPLNLHAHLDVPRTPDLGTFVEALLGPG